MSVVHFNEENARDLNQSIPKKKVFLLIYMEGCNPCMKMKPEWAKIENIFKKQDKNILIGDIERTHLPQLNNLNYKVNSFPTILYLSKNSKVETFEDAGFQERNIDNFMKWINTKCKKIRPKTRKIGRKKIYKLKGGKWSRKYKKSINCNKPKGFSQRQYCKYGRH